MRSMPTRQRARGTFRPYRASDAGVGRPARPDDLRAGAKAVVEHSLRNSVAVRVEQPADVTQAVPLRRILQIDDGQIVVDNVGASGPLRRNNEIRPPVAHRRPQQRRVAARIERVAAGIVERQAETESDALGRLRQTLAQLVPGDED